MKMASSGDSKAYWCKEALEKNGTLVLRELLKKRVSDLYKPYDIASLLSKSPAEGDLKVKKHQFKQLLDNNSFNDDEQQSLDLGDVNRLDISCLTRLLKIPQIGGIASDIVSERRWTDIMKHGKSGQIDKMLYPQTLNRSGIDERPEVKIAGLITVIQYYRNKLSHKTDNGHLPPEFWSRAPTDIDTAIKELACFAGLEEHQLHTISTSVIDQDKLKEICSYLNNAQDELYKLSPSSILGPIQNSAKPPAEPVNWMNMMNGWSENSQQAVRVEQHMRDIPDYIPVGLLSMLSDIQSPPDIHKALESGRRLFQQTPDELRDSIHYFEAYLSKHPSEAVVVKIHGSSAAAELPEYITRIHESYELYDIRGKVSILDHYSKPKPNVHVCNSESWNDIHHFLHTHGDYKNCHDVNIPIKITESKCAETTSKIHSLVTENNTLVSVGGVLLSQEADAEFIENVIKLNMKWKHVIMNIIKSDNRLPQNILEPYQKTSIRDKLQNWTLAKIALNQWHSAAVQVIENEFGKLEDYRKFLNDLADVNVIEIYEKVEILLKLKSTDPNIALTSLFSLLQKRTQSELEREKDITAFLNVVKRKNMLPLFYFIKEVIMQIRRIESDEATGQAGEIETEQLTAKISLKDDLTNVESFVHYNPNQHMIDDPEECIGALFDGFGENPSAKTGCVEITVDVSSQWEIENIKKSIECGAFLSKYIHWLREKGVNVKEEKDIEIKLCLGDEVLLVKSQDAQFSKLEIEDTLHNWLESVFENITQNLGSDWDQLALSLGTPQARIDALTHRHTSQERRALHMLYEWSEGFGNDRENQVGDKLERLLKALHKCGCDDLINSIKGSENVPGSKTLLLEAKHNLSNDIQAHLKDPVGASKTLSSTSHKKRKYKKQIRSAKCSAGLSIMKTPGWVELQGPLANTTHDIISGRIVSQFAQISSRNYNMFEFVRQKFELSRRDDIAVMTFIQENHVAYQITGDIKTALRHSRQLLCKIGTYTLRNPLIAASQIHCNTLHYYLKKGKLGKAHSSMQAAVECVQNHSPSTWTAYVYEMQGHMYDRLAEVRWNWRSKYKALALQCYMKAREQHLHKPNWKDENYRHILCILHILHLKMDMPTIYTMRTCPHSGYVYFLLHGSAFLSVLGCQVSEAQRILNIVRKEASTLSGRSKYQTKKALDDLDDWPIELLQEVQAVPFLASPRIIHDIVSASIEYSFEHRFINDIAGQPPSMSEHPTMSRMRECEGTCSLGTFQDGGVVRK